MGCNAGERAKEERQGRNQDGTRDEIVWQGEVGYPEVVHQVAFRMALDGTGARAENS